MISHWRGNADLGLLLIRLALAAVFIVHGAQKFMNLEKTVSFFEMLGQPAFMAYVVAAVEVLAGLAMLLGIGVEIAGVLLALVMVGAIYLVKGKMGFLGGYELDLVLLLSALGVALVGAGRYALGKK